MLRKRHGTKSSRFEDTPESDAKIAELKNWKSQDIYTEGLKILTSNNWRLKYANNLTVFLQGKKIKREAYTQPLTEANTNKI